MRLTFSSKLDLVSDIITIAKYTLYCDGLHDFSATIPWCYSNVNVNSFFPRTASFWNSLSIECFALNYDLNGLKSRINRYLLTAGSFRKDFL